MSRTEPPIAEAPPAPEPPAPSRRRGIAKLAAFFLALLLLVSGGALYVRAVSSGSGKSVPVTVVIPEGASVSKIASILVRAHVIKGAWLFKLIARFDDRSRDIKPGEYHLRTGMSYDAVFAALAAGPSRPPRITIPEGKTITEIASIVGRNTSLSADAFLAAARSGRHRLPIMPPGSTNLEGLLFPETYDLDPKTTADDLVQTMLDQFTSSTAFLDFGAGRRLGLTPYQVVIVASMVEREAKVPEDRPRIARVIYNRLAKGMRLQVDATVQYAIFERTGSYRPRLTFEDYRISSPYNTYQIPRLPPAPIASPGLASLDAALHPSTGAELYYVLCDRRGGHAFARTQQDFDRLKRICASRHG